MLKKLLFTNLACFLWLSSFSQWSSQTSNTTDAFTSLYFIDANKGFAVNGVGGIYSTSNAGINWTLVTTVGSSLYNVSFGNANKGCVVGAGGSVWTTVDAGATWSSGSSGQSYALSSVFFVGIDSAYAVGNNGTILKSLNAGMMWSQKISGTLSDLKSVYFTDGITGYAVGLGGTILKTIDAGVNWLPQTSGTIQDLLSVYFTDANTGYASGNNGTILKTTNAGLTWSPLSSGTSNILNSIRFANASIGYAVGAAQTILKTNDAGATWYTQIPVTSDNLYSVYFIDANTGYTVGAFGKILKTINGGCTTPTLTVSGGTTICVGSSTNLSVIGASAYVWSPSTGLDCSTCPNVSASPTSNTTYSITGTSTEGCSNVTAVSITVNSLYGGYISIPPSICVGGDPDAFTETNVATGSGVTTYDWKSSADGYVSTLATTLLYDVPPGLTSTTIYRRIATFTLNGVSCTANSNDITVTVNPLPLADAGTDVPLCLGDPATLTASGGTSYTWYDGGSSISAAISLTVNPTTTTAYRVDVTNSFGCSKLDTVIVNVNPLPTVSAGPSQSICLGASAMLTASGAGTTYVWSTGSTAISITETPATTTIYFVTGTNGNNCSNNDTVQVTVNSLPIIVTGADVSVCTGQSTTLLVSGGVTYLWSTGAVTNSITETPTATTSYFVKGTDGNNCAQNDTVLVTVNSLPIVSISLSVPICEGQSETLTASGGAIFAWSTGASTNSITETPATTTAYTVIVTDGNNCSDSETATILVNPVPIAIAGADQTICFGDTATLSGAGGIAYVWTDGINSFNTPTILVTPAASTQYSLTVTDNSGCTASDTAVVSVTPSKDIFGHASYSGGPVTNGTAVLYKYEQFQTRFDSIQYVPLDQSTGDYVFSNVNYGDYLVKVFADSASYPTLINTYYGDEFLWDGDSVQVINHSCDLNTTLDSVTMVELTGTGGGIGLIIGQIIEGVSFGRVEGEPIPGVDIELGKNPGGIIATTQTNGTGHYTFSGVADGNYTIYVDIPGLGRDSSYTFDVDSTNNQFLNQNYIADSNSVFMNPTSTVGIVNHANAVENKFSVYPNPVKGNTTIEYTIQQMTESKITLEIYTILGVKISTLVHASQQVGIYKYNFNPQTNNLNCGVYLISLCVDGQTSTKRIIVME